MHAFLHAWIVANGILIARRASAGAGPGVFYINDEPGTAHVFSGVAAGRSAAARKDGHQAMWSSLIGKAKPKADERKVKLSSAVQQAQGPALHPEEKNGNLSELEKRLNREMKCPAGKNQVFIRSLVTASGTTQPRIALRCHLRKDASMTPDIFFEHIRDVCCSNPDGCPAYKKFKDRFVPT